MILAAGRVGVDQEFPANGVAVGIVDLGVDAVAPAVLEVGGPDDDEAAGRQARHCGLVLPACYGRVGAELRAYGAAATVIALAVNAVAVPILARGRPSDDEPAATERRNCGLMLPFDLVGVDKELVADRIAGGIVLPGKDAFPASVRGFPGDDEPAAFQGRDHGSRLPAHDRGVDLEIVP